MIFGSVIVKDDVIYFGSGDGYLYALEIDSDSQGLIDQDE